MPLPAPLRLLLAVALTTLPPHLPQARAAPLEDGGTARVVEVIDGDTVKIEDGTEIRLVGTQAPKLPLGRRNFVMWPLAEEAKAALETLALGKTVRLSYGGARQDRHDRRLAHLHVEAGDGAATWIQGEMLRRGLARVYTFPDNRALAAEMLDLERGARAEGAGIWNHPFYAVLPPERTGRHVDSFQLVEGTVLTAETVKGRVYLNFGEDWKTDFTVGIAPDAARLFRAARLDPKELAGARIRIRGWISFRNGPAIEATHPEQLERLDETGNPVRPAQASTRRSAGSEKR